MFISLIEKAKDIFNKTNNRIYTCHHCLAKLNDGSLCDCLDSLKERWCLQDNLISMPDKYVAAQEYYETINQFFWQLNRFMSFVIRATESHGGQHHQENGCDLCFAEKENWLTENHPNWREEAKEAGCCRTCILRAYKFLKDKNNAASS
jgi:hypothetical protein